MSLKKSENFTIWPPFSLYGNWKIGKGTTIGAFADIGGRIGKNCKIQAHVSIPHYCVVEDKVFLGPGVKLCNDKKMDGKMKGIKVCRGAKIGAGAILVANVGKNSIIGAGSVVLSDVPEGETWVGSPARKIN